MSFELAIPVTGDYGLTSGPSGDGIRFGNLPPAVLPKVFLTKSSMSNPSRVIFGDSSGGKLTYTDITTESNNAATDIVFPNTTDSGDDELLIELISDILSITLMLEVPGDVSGGSLIVDYDDGTKWVNVPLDASTVDIDALKTSSAKSLLTIKLASILKRDLIATTRAPLVSEVRGKFIRIRGVGVTVTTPPQFSRVFLQLDPDNSASGWVDATPLIQPIANPDFSLWGIEQFKVKHNIDVFGFEEWPINTKKVLYGLDSGTKTRTPVYWNGTKFSTIPAGYLNDPSLAGRAVLTGTPNIYYKFVKETKNTNFNSAATTIEKFSGDITATWAVSGGRVMLGFNDAAGDSSYEDMDYALYRGASFFEVFENGTRVLTSTLPISNAVLKIEKVGTVVKYHVGTTVMYTSLVPASAASYVVDMSLYEPNSTVLMLALFSGGVYQPVTWGSEVNIVRSENPVTTPGAPTNFNLRLAKPQDAAKTLVNTYVLDGVTITKVDDGILPAGATQVRIETLYLIGYEQSEDEPTLTVNEKCTIEAQCLDVKKMKSSLNIAVPGSLTKIALSPDVVDDTPGTTTTAFVNTKTGEMVVVTGDLNKANPTIDETVSLDRSAGDGLIAIQIASKGSNDPSGGFIFISG